MDEKLKFWDFQGVTFLSKWGQIRNSEKTQRVRVWFKDNIWSEPPSISISALTLFGGVTSDSSGIVVFSAVHKKSGFWLHKLGMRFKTRQETCGNMWSWTQKITGNHREQFSCIHFSINGSGTYFTCQTHADGQSRNKMTLRITRAEVTTASDWPTCDHHALWLADSLTNTF